MVRPSDATLCRKNLHYTVLCAFKLLKRRRLHSLFCCKTPFWSRSWWPWDITVYARRKCSHMIYINKSTSCETWCLSPCTYCSVRFIEYSFLHRRAIVSQPMWAPAGGDGTPGAGHVEELHRPVRLCKQGHHQPPSGGPHHQPERTCSRGTRQHPGRSESSLVKEAKLKFYFLLYVINSSIKTVEFRLGPK